MDSVQLQYRALTLGHVLLPSMPNILYDTLNYTPDGSDLKPPKSLMALVENVAAVVLRAGHCVNSTIHGENDKIATHRAQ